MTAITGSAILKEEIAGKGFAIVNGIFTREETDSLLKIISATNSSNPSFRQVKDVYAIRRFLKEVPEALSVVMNERLKILIAGVFGDSYFIVKSIYFDKPGESNWFVSYHQDLTISVNRKEDVPGFGPWSVKPGQFAVQPPLSVLENNFTIRIHLDITDEKNGALRVIPGSHRRGVYRPENIDLSKEAEAVCAVERGGIMIMRPLLLHASGRTTDKRQRRVIHIEFSNQELPAPLKWSEKQA